MNRYLPIIFLLGIIFNFGCVVVFRLRLDRRNDDQYDRFRTIIEGRVSDLSRDALIAIDSYFASNYVRSSSSSFSPEKSVLYDTVGQWSYLYCEVGSGVYAISNNRRYTIGDRYPRGGYITEIHPDGVVLDDCHFIENTYNPQTIKPLQGVRNGTSNYTSIK